MAKDKRYKGRNYSDEVKEFKEKIDDEQKFCDFIGISRKSYEVMLYNGKTPRWIRAYMYGR